MRTLAFAYPSLMVMFRTSSFLNRTVMTPDIAFTTVDFPWATWPIVPAIALSARAAPSGRGLTEVDCSLLDTRVQIPDRTRTSRAGTHLF